MSSVKPIVVVSGATGAQGGSVVQSLLSTGKFHIRALTRKPDSEKAKALAAKGVEVIKADLFSREDVEKALKGANIAWIVTNFWDPTIVGGDPQGEIKQGKLIADSAKKVGLNWLIYSSLSDTTAGSNGRYNAVVHFTGKNQVEQYIRNSGIPNSTFVYPGFYMSNFGQFFQLVEKDGYVQVAVPIVNPDTKLPLIDANNDVGPIVAKIIEEGPAKWNGKAVPAAAEYVTLTRVAEILTKVTGKDTRFNVITEEEVKTQLPHFNNEESLQMLGWFRDYGYYGKDTEVSDLSVIEHLHPNITKFEQWAEKNLGKK